MGFGARIDGVLSAPRIGRVAAPVVEGEPAHLQVPDAPLDRVPSSPQPGRSSAAFAAGWLSMRKLKTAAVIGAIAATSLMFGQGPAMAEMVDCRVPAAEARAMEREEVTLREGLCRYVESDFGGDWDAAWRQYAGSDNRVSRAELRQLLRAAEIGGGLTRGFWVDGVMDRFDGAGGPKNDHIDRAELDAAMD